MRLLLVWLLCSVGVVYGSQWSGARWAWIGGTTYNSQSEGNYVTNAVDALPAARDSHATDTIPNTPLLYLFGGMTWLTDPTNSPTLMNDVWLFNTTDGLWTWIKGSSFTDGNQPGVYPPLGTSTPDATPGGRSSSSATLDGGFAIFGEFSVDGRDEWWCELNDMWTFSWATRQWTWVSGSSVPVNFEYFSSGEVYAGQYGQYDGSSPYPGSRSGTCLMGAGDEVYMYGGAGLASFISIGRPSYGPLNDLWKLNVNTRTWTWIAGSSLPMDRNAIDGYYSAPGVESSANSPRRRVNAACSLDRTAGHIYVHGGRTYPGDVLSDLVKFNLNTNMWSYITGSSLGADQGSSGEVGAFENSFSPSNRFSHSFTTSPQGNFYIYGGLTDPGTGSSFDLPADLWMYDVEVGQWGKIAEGPSNSFATYFDLNAFCSESSPGERAFASMGFSSDSEILLFGGYDDSVWWDYADLWSFSVKPESESCVPQQTLSPAPTLAPTAEPAPGSTRSPTAAPTFLFGVTQRPAHRKRLEESASTSSTLGSGPLAAIIFGAGAFGISIFFATRYVRNRAIRAALTSEQGNAIASGAPTTGEEPSVMMTPVSSGKVDFVPIDNDTQEEDWTTKQ